MFRRAEASLPTRRPRTALICHAESQLNYTGVARWLASFTDLAGIVVIEETHQRTWVRVKREIARIGWLRFVDVVAFRLFYRFRFARRDALWLQGQLDALGKRFSPIPASTRELRTSDPNSRAVEIFLRELSLDFAIARCKRLLVERIFTAPSMGTFVLHPGVCPEYRNAHGAFWALAVDDIENVGLTLLKIDRGVDTGPVYGYFRSRYDETGDTHIVIMTRLVLDNLDAIRDRLLEIWNGQATPLDTRGRRSGEWGQPWLTKYLHWKQQARRRKDARSDARIP
jgi:hypothetical protein